MRSRKPAGQVKASPSSVTPNAAARPLWPIAIACLLLLIVWVANGNLSTAHEGDEDTSSTHKGDAGTSATHQGGAATSVTHEGDAERGRCTVDVIHAKDLTPEMFTNTYYLRKPLIISNVEARSFGGQIGASDLWSVKNLVGRYGDSQVGVGSSRSITKTGGTGYNKVPLQSVVKTILDQAKPTKDVDIYAFDRDSSLFSKAPELLDAVAGTASLLGENYTFTEKKEMTDWSWYVALGGKGSGVHLHHHGDGWLYLFEGSKRWFFYEPDTLPPLKHVGRIPMRDWYSDIYPKFREEELPIECIQLPGDLIYAPDGWWHGTLNEGSPLTVGVASQRKVVLTEREALLTKLNAAKDQRRMGDAVSLANQISSKYPQNAEAWYVLGIVYGRNRQKHLDDELLAKTRSNELSNGRNCDVTANLGAALINKYKFAEAAALLHDTIKLCPQDDLAYLNLAIALEQMGEVAEAKRVKATGQAIQAKFKPKQVRIGSTKAML